MKDGIGEGRTRGDHPRVASQLFAAYSRVKEIRALASVIGKEELSPLDKLYMDFGDAFEASVVTQGEFEDRPVEDSLEIGWQALRILPRGELYRLREEDLRAHYDAPGEAAGNEAPEGAVPNPFGLAAPPPELVATPAQELKNR
jgi:V/A-type H+-transporting ATPase subunit B